MKALVLLSGGLDSTLTLKIMKKQGIDVEAINFLTPFCLCNRKNGCGCLSRKVADRFGVRLKIFNMTTEYFDILKNPKYGYGKNMNPCIDCRILMHKKAKKYMKEIGASFIITGEVLGQRPMSQHRSALKIIEKENGLEGLILRPLSAGLLPMTIPEKEGWINRDSLLKISGRSRKVQKELTEQYNIGDYPCPAGGCLLTDLGFSRRMKDLIEYSDITLNDIELLKIGRHFRLTSVAKLIVGRNEEENGKLLRLIGQGDIFFVPVEVKGPIAIGRGNFNQGAIQKSSAIIARYCDVEMDEKVEIKVQRFLDTDIFFISTISESEDVIIKLRI